MFGFSDLEDKLLGENGEATMSETLAALASLRTETQTALDGGLASEDHAAAAGILQAVAAAEVILASPVKPDGV